MRYFLKYRYEYLALALAIALPIIAFYFGITDSSAVTLRFILISAFIVDAATLFFVIRKLWKTKWKKAFLTSVQKIIAKIAKRLTAFIEKITGGKKAKLISGKTTISFDFPSYDSGAKKHSRVVKWKNLRNDRERLGYLYKHTVERNIKQGVGVFASDTPIDVKAKKDYEIFEDQIFDLYITNRYTDVVEIDNDTLNELKKSLKK